VSFSELGLKPKYDSDEDDILNTFYIPLLSNADRYDRAVGYFSASVLAKAAVGLEKFILSSGKMRLIIGDPLSDDEYEAVLLGKNDQIEKRTKELSDILLDAKDRQLKIITYLIANDQLEIKFAFTHLGMFHNKVGVFYKNKEVVVFSGSANETLAGLTSYNSEKIKVFFSWESTSFETYGRSELTDFEILWENKKKRTRVVSLNSDVYQRLRKNVDKKKIYNEIFEHEGSNRKEEKPNMPTPFFIYTMKKGVKELSNIKLDQKLPKQPLNIKGKPFQLFEHQIKAIKSWKKSDYKGLFKLATGAGKTFTSICATVELYEYLARQSEQLFVVVTVPYIELANQWIEELKPFNISAIPCYELSSKWISVLDKKILRFKSGELNFVCAVVVNKTMRDDKFQSRLKKILPEKILLIGDECHHLASQSLFEKLPPCRYRIGLSATPFRSEDDEMEGSPFQNVAKEKLLLYFGGIVSEYSLNDAIDDDVLTPYVYQIVPVFLTDEEQESYEKYSERIQRLILKAKNKGLDNDEKQILTNLCGFRSRLLATCQQKLPALISYLESDKELRLSHALIYVGEGKAPEEEKNYILKVTNALHEYGERAAKFTSEETSTERKRIMTDFKEGSINALVAMKVLDEGIDVPICKSAFIMASTRNPRQYVQRRGRVLRKADGKDSALIVDFVVMPAKGSNNHYSQNLKKAELQRIEDFKLTALNCSDVDQRILELGIM